MHVNDIPRMSYTPASTIGYDVQCTDIRRRRYQVDLGFSGYIFFDCKTYTIMTQNIIHYATLFQIVCIRVAVYIMMCTYTYIYIKYLYI